MGTNNLDLDDISAILEMLRTNDVTEFRLEREGEKLWLKRGSGDAVSYVPVQVPQSAAQTSFVAPSAPMSVSTVALVSPASAPAGVSVPVATPASNLIEVKSPMVGTFYRRPAVDAQPYVEVGDRVKKGTVLCIVEAMKLMNEIESETTGKIVEVCLEDGKMAEYGEVLFRIDPTGA